MILPEELEMLLQLAGQFSITAPALWTQSYSLVPPVCSLNQTGHSHAETLCTCQAADCDQQKALFVSRQLYGAIAVPVCLHQQLLLTFLSWHVCWSRPNSGWMHAAAISCLQARQF